MTTTHPIDLAIEVQDIRAELVALQDRFARVSIVRHRGAEPVEIRLGLLDGSARGYARHLQR